MDWALILWYITGMLAGNGLWKMAIIPEQDTVKKLAMAGGYFKILATVLASAGLALALGYDFWGIAKYTVAMAAGARVIIVK